MDEQQTPWNPPGPGTTWQPGIPGMPPPVEVPLVTEPAKRNRGRRVAAIGAAGALVAAGGFALVTVTRGNSGGASSPQAAVEQLVEAVNREDVLGALDVMLPGERRTFRDPMVDMVGELRRLEILGGEAKLDAVGGVDLEIDVDEYEVDENGDVATVSVAGTSKARVDQSKIPLGDFTVDQMLDGKQPSETKTTTGVFGGLNDPTRIATVKRDGRWYVSLWYSVAENARIEAGLDLPAPDEAIRPSGAKTPEEAADRMLDSIAKFDLEAIIAGMNPQEAEALQRYAPLFLRDGQSQVDGFLSDAGVSFAVDATEWTITPDGDDQATATLVSAKASVSADGDKASATFADGCLTFEASGEVPDPICADANDSVLKEQGLDGLADIKVRGVHLTKVDGEWYVSPLATMMGAMVDVLRGVDRADLDKIVDSFQTVAEQVTDGLGIDLPAVPGLPTVDDPNATVVVPTLPVDPAIDPTIDTVVDTTDTVVTDDTVPSWAGEVCFVEVDTPAATECFQKLVAEGALLESEVPAALRFPECGFAQAYWTGYPDMDDATFTDLVTKAHDCFVAKVASGEMSEFDVPWEAQHPECWKGVNPIGPNSSPNSFDEYQACAEA